jgi:uncharacterized protein YbjQ (UPF0145 family)
LVFGSKFFRLECFLTIWNGTAGKKLPLKGIDMDHSLVTTNIQLDGYRVVKHLGVVRGIIVRSRSVFGNIGAGIQMLFGGNISLYTDLCEQTRSDAYEIMIQHAEQRGANAVMAFRYDATEIASGVTEVLAYGTAVVVERIS